MPPCDTFGLETQDRFRRCSAGTRPLSGRGAAGRCGISGVMRIGGLRSGMPGQRLLSFSCLEQSDKGTSESPVAF
jgi:hypothetical protein